MALTIFNTLTRKEESFEPLAQGIVSLYTCGPTVYNYPHIGNYRAYIFADILKRYLKYRGYTVKHVMNITDVDDKTIRDSIASGKSLKDFTEFYTKGFLEDTANLNIIMPNLLPKATDTESIDGMIHIIEELLDKGFAYKGADGSIYFDIRRDAEYGKLSHISLSTLKENADGRITKDEYDKENAEDFALWKAWDEKDGEVFWNTPFGKGRPGWHIECSAMSRNTLGESIDIHTGGVDLIFPHHENEIAQSECASGKPFAKYFMHNEHLLVDGAKMSKSAGNFYTLRDLTDKGIEPLAFRYWLYMGHYRTKVNFTLESVMGAQTALHRLYGAYRALGETVGEVQSECKNAFEKAMDTDLNTPQALALVWEILKDPTISNEDKKATLLDFDTVLGFGLADLKQIIIPDEVKKLVIEREQARLAKDWVESDKLRDQIHTLGFEVKDTEEGPRISKI